MCCFRLSRCSKGVGLRICHHTCTPQRRYRTAICWQRAWISPSSWWADLAVGRRAMLDTCCIISPWLLVPSTTFYQVIERTFVSWRRPLIWKLYCSKNCFSPFLFNKKKTEIVLFPLWRSWSLTMDLFTISCFSLQLTNWILCSHCWMHLETVERSWIQVRQSFPAFSHLTSTTLGRLLLQIFRLASLCRSQSWVCIRYVLGSIQ